MKVILGIDPGQKGGIAALSATALLVRQMPPVDSNWTWFREWIATFRPTAFVEKVHSMPKQGVASTFKFGMGYGFIRGLLAAWQVPTFLVPPQTWKKVMLAGENKLDQKAAAR